MFDSLTLLAADPPAGPAVPGWSATGEVGGMDADEALEAAARWDRVIAYAQAQQLRVLARFAALRSGSELEEFTADEVAPVLHLSRVAADARLELATRLVTCLPETLDALQAGTIDLPKARAISEATDVLEQDATTTVQNRVLDRASTQTTGELRAALRRAVLAADPDAAAHRHRAARADRRVQLHPHQDGMGALWALLPADDATAAYIRLDTLARQFPSDDPRGIDARRADVLVDLLLGRDTGAPQPSVELQVILDAGTLTGLADHPGELAGHGPVPADLARELAAAARHWRAGVLDERTGRLTRISVAYRPRKLINLVVQARDRTCTFPGCRRPARRCDLDHTIPYDRGGTTWEGNLGPLCRHHHRLKTHTSWELSQPEPGLFLWTSPTGRVHHFRAPPPTELRLTLQPHPPF